MQELEQTLDSTEVADMVAKDHSKLLRDIRRYVNQLGEAKIGQSDFFKESTYKNSQNKSMPCYRITKKGCEFIAHKLTGQKGTEFTAKYINRFHDMEDALKLPASRSKRVTFLQEVKAAEYVTKEMTPTQKMAFYKSIYNRYGINFDIPPELYAENKGGSRCDQYRNESVKIIRQINNEHRLCIAYSFVKRLLLIQQEET